jgi:phosphoribosyl-ATP pyrophosphohydrolase
MSEFAYLDTLVATIKSRVGGDPKVSHVAKLLKKGTARIAKKVGEEAVEVAIAAVTGDMQHNIDESADLLFHLLILWQAESITAADVMAELQRRENISGITEKQSRTES